MEVVAEAVDGELRPGTAPRTVLRTVLRTVRSHGQALAVRRTTPEGTGTGADGAAHVHLVGTAAGPMGGDVVEVRLVVGPGARLEVAAVAATVVLPSRAEARAELRLEADVAPGGLLVCAMPPVVVTGRAGLAATTRVRRVGDGQVRLVEHVRLGRHGEPGGWWQGRLDVTRDGVAVLRQTTTLGAVPDDGIRELRSDLDTRPRPGDAAGSGAPTAVEDADPWTVRLEPAAGGRLVVTLGPGDGEGPRPGARTRLTPPFARRVQRQVVRAP